MEKITKHYINFYQLEYSDCCLHLYCYFHNVLAHASFDLLLLPNNVNKGIFPYLQHRAKAISWNTDAYKDEIKSLKDNLRHYNNPENITAAPRNPSRSTKNPQISLQSVCSMSKEDAKAMKS